MQLINPTPLLRAAQKEGCAIAAFNIHNLETLEAVAEAANEERAPIMIATSVGTLKYAGLPFIAACAKVAAHLADVPFALHMDHCPSFDLIARCIQAGYTSVMIDTSKLDYADNVAMVRKVIELAHACGVQVEGEIGRIGGVEDDLYVKEGDAAFTDPEEARQFVADTGLDSLAIAIGTAHGEYKGEPHLDFPRLTAIRQVVDIPLVLHGASGVPDEQIQEGMRRGVCKVNIATELKIPMAAAIRDVFLANPKENDPRAYLGAGKAAVKERARKKIRLCGSNGLADRL